MAPSSLLMLYKPQLLVKANAAIDAINGALAKASFLILEIVKDGLGGLAIKIPTVTRKNTIVT